MKMNDQLISIYEKAMADDVPIMKEDGLAFLLDYIREYASVFHYAPRYKEIIGWKLISDRFGSWGAAIERAGLHLSSSCPVERLPRIQEEVRKQKELYRQRKAEKKILSEQRRLQQEAKQKEAAKKK